MLDFMGHELQTPAIKTRKAKLLIDELISHSLPCKFRKSALFKMINDPNQKTVIQISSLNDLHHKGNISLHCSRVFIDSTTQEKENTSIYCLQ